MVCKRVERMPPSAGGTWPGIVKECILGALATQLIAADSQIVSIYHRCLGPSCVTRTLAAHDTPKGCCVRSNPATWPQQVLASGSAPAAGGWSMGACCGSP